MEFFDCNCYIGLPTNKIQQPVRTADELLAHMDRSGIGKALVWHVAQRDASVEIGNDLLAKAIAPHRGRLAGTWTILPTSTRELPPPGEFFKLMKKHNIRALRAFPNGGHNYLLCRESVGGYLDKACAAGVPLLVSGLDWRTLYDLMRDFPKLTCILCNVGLWGPDRWFRPLVENYPNFHVEISSYVLAGGIADFVKTYGAKRLLFGTAFPEMEHGGMMLTLRHAEISEKDKAAVAGGNMERILKKQKL
jgi:uncharacterized protein